MTKIFISHALTRFSNNKREIHVSSSTFVELMHFFSQEYPDLYRILFNDKKQISEFVLIYCNKILLNNNIELFEFSDNDVIEIISAVSGG